MTGQHVGDDATVLACRVLEADDWCHECGAKGSFRDTVGRRLAHVPLGWRPTTLLVYNTMVESCWSTMQRELLDRPDHEESGPAA